MQVDAARTSARRVQSTVPTPMNRRSATLVEACSRRCRRRGGHGSEGPGGRVGRCSSLLLAALATTVGLGSFGWGVGLACGVVVTVAVARGGAACAGAGRPDHAFPCRAHLRSCRAGRGLLRPQRGRRHSRRARDRRPGVGRDRRLGGEAHADGVDVRCPVRRRGRRLPDPGPQRVRRRHGRTAGCWRSGWPATRSPWPAGCCPGCARQLPPRYWRKVVTAAQGIVLTVAAADVAPPWLVTVALVVALALLTESFGRDVLWLWQHRSPGRARLRPGRTPPACRDHEAGRARLLRPGAGPGTPGGVPRG